MPQAGTWEWNRGEESIITQEPWRSFDGMTRAPHPTMGNIEFRCGSSETMLIVYHSHVPGDNRLSDGDRRTSDRLRVPIAMMSSTSGPIKAYADGVEWVIEMH